MSKIKLPQELEEDFVLVKWPGNSHCQLFGPFGKVDLELLNKKQADRLVRMKFPYLQKKEQESKAEEEKALEPKPKATAKTAKK